MHYICGMKTEKTYSQMRKGVLELCILSIISDAEVYTSDILNSLKMVEWDKNNHLLKINPLINWSENEVNEYIKSKNIPVNPLHKQGFASIGCQPCTRAIEHGEDIRAGRWWWENPETKECGLHKR